MAKQNLTITLTIEYDPSKNDGKPANIFLYQFITKLNREWPIVGVGYKGIKKIFKNNEINNIALKKVDSIDNKNLPKKPSWLKNAVIMEPRKPKKTPPAWLKDRTILNN